MHLFDGVTITPWTVALAPGTFRLDEHQNISTFYSEKNEVHYFKIVAVTQLVDQSQNVFPCDCNQQWDGKIIFARRNQVDLKLMYSFAIFLVVIAKKFPWH